MRFTSHLWLLYRYISTFKWRKYVTLLYYKIIKTTPPITASPHSEGEGERDAKKVKVRIWHAEDHPAPLKNHEKNRSQITRTEGKISGT